MEPFEIFIVDFTKPDSDKRILNEIANSLSFYYPTSFFGKLTTLLSLNTPLDIRNEAVLLLQNTLSIDGTRISYVRLDELKTHILEYFKIELQEQLLPPLISAIADIAEIIYDSPLPGWLELLEYIVSCITLNSNDDESVLNQRKGLMLLPELPNQISEHIEFWRDHYRDLYENLVARMHDGTADENSQTLIFGSLCTMLVIAQPVEEYEIGDSILLNLLDLIDRHSDEEILLIRCLYFRALVSNNLLFQGKEGIMFQAMLRIAEKNGISKELRCAAIEVLESLSENSSLGVMKLSDVDAQRVIKVSLEMMFQSDTQSFKLGKCLLKWLSFKTEEESLVFPMLTGSLKSTYSVSKDLKKRHTVIMDVLARFDENISDGSLFANEIIKMIADEINHAISISIIECGRAQGAGTSEGGSEHLSDEEIILSSRLLISTTVKAFKHRLAPCAEELFSSISQLWGNDFPDRVKAITFSFMNVIGQHFPDILQIYHDKYTYELLKAGERSLHAQMETARGIAICAMYGGNKFKTIVNEAISKLYSLIKHGYSIKGEEPRYGTDIFEMAVAALGMICEFHRENVDGRPEVIRNWLSLLPLTDNPNPAEYTHGQLCRMLKRQDADVLGPNKENLPRIISILRASCFITPDELATEETFSEITLFLDNHGGDL